MRLPNDIVKCVGFLCVKTKRVGYEFIGNAFVITTTSGPNKEDDGFEYLVTAKHCVEDGRKRGGLFIRLNTANGGADTVRIPDNWVFSEHEDKFDVDVAVMRFIPSRDDFEYRAIQDYGLIDRRDTQPPPVELWETPVGVGDDLAVCGLFAAHHGKKRNVPIVRFGTIAAMPSEEIQGKSESKPYLAYLIELRSLGGLSGSPVFLTVERVGENISRRSSPVFFLLGLIRSHWYYKLDSSVITYSQRELPEVNAGIAAVTPSEYIKDIIYGEEISKQRKKEEAERPEFLR